MDDCLVGRRGRKEEGVSPTEQSSPLRESDEVWLVQFQFLHPHFLLPTIFMCRGAAPTVLLATSALRGALLAISSPRAAPPLMVSERVHFLLLP